jgi:hypothetical protein
MGVSTPTACILQHPHSVMLHATMFDRNTPRQLRAAPGTGSQRLLPILLGAEPNHSTLLPHPRSLLGDFPRKDVDVVGG